MKVLFITYHYLRGVGGSVFASRAYINAFAELADEMTLLCPVKEGYAPEGIHPKVTVIPVYDSRSRIEKGFDLLLGRSNRFRSHTHFADRARFDTVVFDTSMVTHGLIRHFKGQGIKVVTIHHNYQLEYFRDNAPVGLRLPTLFWSYLYEQEAVRNSDLNLTLTEADSALLRQHYGKGDEVFKTLGTFEFDRRQHPILPDVPEARFLITGNLSAPQTVDSLLPWFGTYYPVLKEVFPSSSLTIAGKSPSDKLMGAADQRGIKVIPSPVSMETVLSEARYYICPTSLGGGIKLRVMDGLSYGLPVVCHRVSARGYESFIEAGMVLVYHDPDSFRQALQKLADSSYLRKDIIELYEKEFSFDSGRQRLAELLENSHITKKNG